VSLQGKKVVVVGGSSGIGLAVVNGVLELGGQVVIASRHAPETVGHLGNLKGRVSLKTLDVTWEKSVVEFFENVGAFDHLVVTVREQAELAPFFSLDIARLKRSFNTKLWGQLMLVRHGAARINGRGSIVLTSGITSQKPFPGHLATAVANGATEALCKALAVELAPLRVNVVCPGFTENELLPDAQSEDLAELAARFPVGRIGSRKDMAGAYLYLMQDDYTTGSVVVVDGGANLV
jgi:NAD(P)-dependent dehydrogenase (short-subunit alcohol dehydrogenase family)